METDILTRLNDIATIPIARGVHHKMDEGACIMELVSYVAGEPWSDHPACVSPCIATFLRVWNDALSDEERPLLKPLIPVLLNTLAPEQEQARAYLALDWLARTFIPAWLDCAGLGQHSIPLRGSLPLTSDATTIACMPAVTAARAAFSAAARAAAGAAAAVEDAAAVGDAAWAAARAAAGAAVRDAVRDAAWDAAWAAAAVGAALCPTVVQLQHSALDLVKRMIACGQETL